MVEPAGAVCYHIDLAKASSCRKYSSIVQRQTPMSGQDDQLARVLTRRWIKCQSAEQGSPLEQARVDDPRSADAYGRFEALRTGYNAGHDHRINGLAAAFIPTRDG